MTGSPTSAEQPGIDTRRLFVAITPPRSVLAHLGPAVDELAVSRGAGAAARLTPREGWHVTLAFLGAVESSRIDDATTAVGRAVDGWSVRRREPLTLGLEGSGMFGSGDRRVLWAGLSGDLLGLHTLAEAVRAELNATGLATDAREFQPHLTISRPGADLPAAMVTADAHRLDAYVGLLWTVESVDLYASDAVAEPGDERVRRHVYTRLSRTKL